MLTWCCSPSSKSSKVKIPTFKLCRVKTESSSVRQADFCLLSIDELSENLFVQKIKTNILW